jgi:sRNA-binding carbon storage regulator CsrA
VLRRDWILDALRRSARSACGCIHAPKNVAVHREEIYEQIQREQAGDEGAPSEVGPDE